MAGTSVVIDLLLRARDSASDVMDRVRAGVSGIGDAVSQALAPLRTFGGLLTAAIGVGGLKELTDYADAYTRLTNSLKVATKSQQEFQDAEQTVVRIAAETRSALETTAQLYSRINQNRKAMNVTEKETADLTELISKGMQLGGASAQEYGSAVLQLTQSFGSGVLRGEEFNAVMEASPELMRQLAAGLGVAVGELRGLAEQGVLTSTVVARALLSQKDAIDAAYNKTTKTVEQSFEQLKNASVLFFGKLNEQTGATRTFGEGLSFLAKNLDAVVSLMGAAAAASFAKFAQGASQAVAASLAAREAAREQAIAEAARQREILATAQANAAAAQGAYNRALAESRLAQQIVAAMQAELGYGVTETELAAARTRAAGAAQLATAATERYAAAQAALNAAQAPAAAGASLFGRALGFLAGPGGLILTAVAAMGLLYSAFAKQKQPTDDLTQSTKDYTEALKKLSTAQTEAELNKINTALAEQRQRVQEAQQAYDQVANSERGWITVTEDLGPILGKVNRVISDANEIARIRTERHAELDSATQRLASLEERRGVVIAEVAKKQAAANAESANSITQQAQMQTAMTKYIQRTEEVAKQQQSVANANQKRIESEIELAKVSGDVQREEALNLQLAQERAKIAKEQASNDLDIALAAKMKLTAMEAEFRQYQNLEPEQKKNLENARADEKQKRAQAAASAAVATQLGVQAQQTENTHAAQQKMLALVDQFRQAQTQAAAADLAAAKAALELAKAKGDEEAAAKALVVVKQKEVIETQRAADANRANLQALLAQRQALIDQAGGIDKLTAAQRIQLGILDQQIAAKQKDIAASETDIETKKREARQAEIMAGPIGQLTRLYSEQAREHQRAADASERHNETQLKEVEGAIRVAQARGDEAEAAKLQAQQQQLLIEQAEQIAANRAQEAADAQKAVDAKALELAADGELSKADKEQITNLQAIADEKKAAAQQAENNAESTRKEAQASKGAVEGMDLFTDARRRNEQMTRRQTEADKERGEQLKMQGSWVSGILTGWQQRLGSFSDTARQAFDEVRAGAKSVTEGLSQIDIAIQKNEREMRVAQEGAFRGEGLVKWANQVAVQALTVERSFLAQAKAVETFSENLHAAGEGGLASARKLEILIQQAEASKSQLTLLDQSQLDHLQQEIDNAKQKLQELQNEAISATDRVAELDAEIAKAEGNDAAYEKMRLQIEQAQSLREVEANLAKARAENNRELIALYEAQAQKLNTLYTLKERNIEQAAREKTAQAQTETTPSGSTAGTRGGTGISAAPSKVYQLNLVGQGGKALTATTDTDPNDFLEALETAKRRSIF